MELASRDAGAERDMLLGAAPAEQADAPPHEPQRPRALRLWLLLRRAAREEPLLFQTLAGAWCHVAAPRSSAASRLRTA